MSQARETAARFLLTLPAGAALAVLHVAGGFLLTPFFGVSLSLWSSVVGSMPVALGLGVILAGALASAGKRRPGLPWHLGALAGVLTVAVPVALPFAARGILDRAPDAAWGPTAAVLALVTLPAALAAGCGLLAARIEEARYTGLAVGGVLGLLLAAPALDDPLRAPPWGPHWVAGAAVALAGLLGAGRAGKVLTLGATAAGIAALVLLPGEMRALDYREALSRAAAVPIGRYYLETAPVRTVQTSELARRYAEMNGDLARSKDRSAAPLIIAQTLRGMGPFETTGVSLFRVLEPHLGPTARDALAPFLGQVEKIRSDGLGTISLSIPRARGGEEVVLEIPTGSGSARLAATGDIVLSIYVARGHDDVRTTIEVGPVQFEPAGTFESNDTFRSPMLVKNARLFVDAHLLAIEIRTDPRWVVVSARAQGPVGGVVEKEISRTERAPQGR